MPVRMVLMLLMVFCSSLGIAAQPAENSLTPLQLQCSITITNYNGIDHASISKNVELLAIKHKPGGAVLVSQTDDYQFWVMIHGQQALNNVKFFNNFQVAIMDKKTNIFMHALSDTNNNSNVKPLKARLSLVKYFPNSFLEEGELLFECISK